MSDGEREQWKRLVRGLLRYADGHELQDPDKSELRQLKDNASKMLAR